MTGHLNDSATDLLAEAVNFLSDDPDRSDLSSSFDALWEAMLVAAGGSGSRLDLSVPAMMAATWNALEPGANASHLRMGEGELLAGIVNALNGDSAASHLTNSVSELYSMLRDASEEGLGPRIVLTGNTIAEDASVGDLVGTLSVSNGSGSYSFTMTATGGGKFALDGVDDTRVEVAAGLNYETATSHQITIEADNGVDPVLERTFTIAVANVLEVTLNALTLDTDEIEEGSAEDTVVGAIQGKSSGSTLALTDSAGNRFKLSGTNIVAGPVATDFDLATSHNITVRETHADGSNSPRDSDIPITVTEAGLAAGLSAPTILWTSAPNINEPTINVVHPDLQEGDTPVFEFDTVNTFDGADYLEVDTGTIDAGEDAAEEADEEIANAFADDTWYVRCRIDRAGHEEGDWSEIIQETIDTVAPTIDTLSPADNATDVAVDADFILTFNEDIAAGASASFRLYETTGDVLVEEFDETDFAGAVVISGDTLTINWTADLDEGVDYYVQIDSGSVTDLAGNAFTGIADETTWNITSEAPPPATVEWNTADKGANITLSTTAITDDTATKLSASSGWTSVRGTVSHSTGKRYFEIKVVSATHEFSMGGCADSSASLSNNIGDGGGEAAGIDTRAAVTNFAGSFSGAIGSSPVVVGAGDTMNIAIDFDAGKFFVGKNNVYTDYVGSSNPATGTNPVATFTANLTLFPACSLFGGGSGNVALQLLGTAGGTTYSPPSGYSTWA